MPSIMIVLFLLLAILILYNCTKHDDTDDFGGFV